MNALIGEAYRLLAGQGFEYAICGGFAVELFLNTTIIPYLAPEIVLLYKSAHIQREGYQLDFDTTAPLLSPEQKTWLNNALAKQYPQGHVWLEE